MKITDTRAKLWTLNINQKRKNTLIANLSTYEGKDMNNNNRYSSWIANVVSQAYNKANQINKDNLPQYIIIKNAKIDNIYDKEKNKTFYNLTIFDFDYFDYNDKNESFNDNHNENSDDIYSNFEDVDEEQIPF